MGKGEIARYSVFKKLVFQGPQKVSLCGNGLNYISSYQRDNYPTFSTFIERGLVRNSDLFLFRQILDSTKLREIADDNFKFDKDSGKFSERIVNTVGKGEIAPFTTEF